MIFKASHLRGVYWVEVEKNPDIRGFFARTWCEREFQSHGLASRMVQASVSYNKKKGTLRGMHYQTFPSDEVRLVRCIRGMIFIAVVDLRPHSPTYLQHESAKLTMDNHFALYVPPGFALGFQTLVDKTEVSYQMSEFYKPELYRGFRWNDPCFGIDWPKDHRTIHDRDATYPDFRHETIADLQKYPL